ncbi:MAG: NTF2 fold immunity protein [Massilia sp.]
MRSVKRALVAAVLMLFAQLGSAEDVGATDHDPGAHSFVPANGFIPDEKTVAAVAQAVLVPIYGRDAIERQKPFKVTLSNNVWTVTGGPPKAGIGGVFLIQIAKDDARVLRVTHGR